MSRPYSRADYWRRLINEQQAGGLGVAEFCQRKAIADCTFYAWRKRLGLAPAARQATGLQPRFVQVLTRQAPEADCHRNPRPFEPVTQCVEADSSRIEVLLFGGRRLSVGRGFDPRTLCQLLSLLENAELAGHLGTEDRA